MKLGRRGMLAAMPTAAAATPMLAAHFANGSQAEASRSGLGSMLGAGVQGPGVDPSYRHWQTAYDAFRTAMKPHEAADEMRQRFRDSVGMDADLYALKSMPPQRKLLVQIERDRERAEQRRTLFDRLKVSIGEQFGIKNFSP